MEISTNTAQSTNGYTQTTQKNNSSSNTSFDQYMNTQSQKDSQSKNTADSKEDYIEVSDTSKQTQTLTYTQDVAKVQDDAYDPNKKFLNFLDENYPGYFEKNSISKEDEEAIRDVLEDNIVSEEELHNLNFEQAEYLNKIQFNRLDYGPERSDDMMLFHSENNEVLLRLDTTTFTGDKSFNKALHKTFMDNISLNEDEMSKILGELSYTLKQAYTEMELGFNLNQAPTKHGLLHEFEISGFNYENHLVQLIDHSENQLSKLNDPDVRKQYELLNENFSKILENYQDFKK